MTFFNDDWATIGSAKLSLPIVQRLISFCESPSATESEYFVLLGHLARNAAGSILANHAVRVAAKRLVGSGIENARIAVELQHERATEAIRALRGFAADVERPDAELVVARESLEGLRVLFLLVQLGEHGVSPNLELVRSANESAAEIDALVERFSITLDRAAFEHSGYRYLSSLRELHSSEWWHAPRLLHNRRAALRGAADGFVDDFAGLAKWTRTLRKVSLRKLVEVTDLHAEVVRWIDASYGLTNQGRPVKRVLHSLQDLSTAILAELANGVSGRELHFFLAQDLTAILTLYDRVLHLVGPAARVPVDIERLGRAAQGWRVAKLLQCPEGETVINAFRRHHWWQSTTERLEHPEAVASGCVSAAWYVAQTGYRDEGCQWLRRAEELTRNARRNRKTDVMRWMAIADGYNALASLYLQHPEQPNECLDAANRVIALADTCSEHARANDHDRITSVRVRAMTLRAAAWDQQGHFKLAMQERGEALHHIEALPARRLTYGVMQLKRDLCIALGDIDGAELAMLEYLDIARGDIAEAVAFDRANMLLEHGYEEAGIAALQELATRRGRSRWFSRARALLQRAKPTAMGQQELWSIEASAQASFKEARQVAGTSEARARIDHALAENERLLTNNRRDLVALTRKAQLLIQRASGNDFRTAHDILEKLGGDDPYVLFCRGHLAYKRGDFVTASSWLREAYEVAPRAQTAVLLANALRRSHQLSAALEVVVACDSVEDDAPLLDAKGIVQATMGRYVDAWHSFQQACTALASGRANFKSGSTNDIAPRRTMGLCRRLASIATYVAGAEPTAVASFLRREADFAHPFIMACISRMAFDEPLLKVILESAEVPALRKSVAQYAMGACVYWATTGHEDTVPTIVESVWHQLDLRQDRYLVAEFLAGGKPAYRASVRRVLASWTGQALAWLETDVPRWSEVAKHVAQTINSPTYYADTKSLVDKHATLWSSLDALTHHVRQQIPFVREENIARWQMAEVIQALRTSTEDQAQLELLVEGAIRIGSEPVVTSTEELRLPQAPRCLVDITAATLEITRRFMGEPTYFKPHESEDTVLGLRISFDGEEWPTSLKNLLDSEQLMPSDENELSIVVPLEAAPDRRPTRSSSPDIVLPN